MERTDYDYDALLEHWKYAAATSVAEALMARGRAPHYSHILQFRTELYFRLGRKHQLGTILALLN